MAASKLSRERQRPKVACCRWLTLTEAWEHGAAWNTVLRVNPTFSEPDACVRWQRM